jgi:(S)-citramalyl-CoA lyase
LQRNHGDTKLLATNLSTLLFVSGATPNRFDKALATQADSVCIDLEDAVPTGGKAKAREQALAAIARSPRLALRINPVATLAGLRDLVALADAGVRPALLLLPKVESATELAIVTGALGADIALVPLIETPVGLAATASIARASGVAAMMFGGGDMAAELGVELAWEPLLAARGAFLLGCAAAGVPAIDVPFLDLADLAGLEAETLRARALGFHAKAAIHPAQVDIITAALRPSAALIAEAQAADAAFAAAGGAAVRFQGRMLEEPVMRRYRRILAQAQSRGANSREKQDNA